MKIAVLGALGAALCLLQACGEAASNKARTDREARAEARVGTELKAGADAAATALDADMVNAVSAVATATPVALKFRLKEPPRVGQSTHIELALAQEPGLDIDAMLVSMQPGDGLALQSDHSTDFHAPTAGATQRLVVAVKAQQAGLLNLNVTVLVDAGSTSVARIFSIPLIAVEAAQ